MSGVSVTQYLSGMAGSINRRGRKTGIMEFPFVTISRQTGAGGHTLANELVRQINAAGGKGNDGWAIFDKDMCQGVVDDPQLGARLQDLLDERYRNAVHEFVHTLIGGSAQDLGYARLAEVQRQLAKLGKVVFIGRGGSCILKDLPMGVHVRLVAYIDTRQRRVAELLGVSEAAALKEIERSDRERKRLIKTHFRTDIDDPENYDVTWNTSRVPLEHVAQSVLDLVQARKKAHDLKAG